jgi:hypothetical protein
VFDDFFSSGEFIAQLNIGGFVDPSKGWLFLPINQREDKTKLEPQQKNMQLVYSGTVKLLKSNDGELDYHGEFILPGEGWLAFTGSPAVLIPASNVERCVVNSAEWREVSLL